MKKFTIIIFTFFIVGMNLILKSQEMTEEQSLNYVLGAYIGEIMKEGEIPADHDLILKGFKEAYAGNNQFDQAKMQQFFDVLNRKMQEKQQKLTVVEKERGRIFLEENKKKEGVVETASGLQYKVVKMGDGAKPLATDQVKVHYHGTTLDGEVFDSSVQRNEPIVFPLDRVIPGWTEGVQLMPVGSKFIFYIPSNLAYGDNGSGQFIKPGSTLIFEVELFEINPK